MDIILPFLLDNGFSRGVYINADETIADILKHHAYPKAVEQVLADTVILTFALSANLKYNGTFSLNIKGDGPIKSVFVSATHDFQARGYAVFDEEKLPEGTLSNTALFGNAQLLFSMAQPGQEPYQGIIMLTKETLEETVSDYFKQSEQIKTNLVLRRQNLSRRCLLIQQMPLKPDQDLEEAGNLWETETVLLESVRDAELFDSSLSPNDILYRLFHANGVTVFEAKHPTFFCPCHRSKMEKYLKSLSPSERDSLFIDGKITAECQFCGNQFIFNKEDF